MELVKLIAGVSCFGTGLYAILETWFRQRKVQESQSWPSVDGNVIASEVRKETNLTASMTPLMTFKASIRYEYTVSGTRYESHTICIGGELNTSMRERAEDRCQHYPLGARVSVFYDPQCPRFSCLERRGETALFVYGIGVIFSVVGVSVAVW